MHIPRDTCLASVAVIFSITVFTATPASLLRATQGFQRSHLRSANGGRLPQAAKAFIFRGTFDHNRCNIVNCFEHYRARMVARGWFLTKIHVISCLYICHHLHFYVNRLYDEYASKNKASYTICEDIITMHRLQLAKGNFPKLVFPKFPVCAKVYFGHQHLRWRSGFSTQSHVLLLVRTKTLLAIVQEINSKKVACECYKVS